MPKFTYVSIQRIVQFYVFAAVIFVWLGGWVVRHKIIIVEGFCAKRAYIAACTNDIQESSDKLNFHFFLHMIQN